MKRPGEQYSIYKPKDETADSGSSSGDDKPANGSKDAAPAKPSSTPNQADSQTSPSQPKPQSN
jgi:hypothetical protein